MLARRVGAARRALRKAGAALPPDGLGLQAQGVAPLGTQVQSELEQREPIGLGQSGIRTVS
mgnify:CR=1 FL=1